MRRRRPPATRSGTASATARSRGPAPGSSARAFVRAAPDDREYFDAAMRPAFLRRVAEDTGGRFYTPATATSLPEDITYLGRGDHRDAGEGPVGHAGGAGPAGRAGRRRVAAAAALGAGMRRWLRRRRRAGRGGRRQAGAFASGYGGPPCFSAGGRLPGARRATSSSSSASAATSRTPTASTSGRPTLVDAARGRYGLAGRQRDLPRRGSGPRPRAHPRPFDARGDCRGGRADRRARARPATAS